MTKPTAFANPWPQGVGIPGGDPTLPPGQPDTDCCDDSAEMPDRALDGNTFIGAQSGDGSLVQSDDAEFSSGAPTLAYPSDTTAGNLLVATMVTRGGSSVPTLAGWNAVGGGGIVNPSEARMWWKVAPGGAVTVTPSTVDTVMRLCVMEFSGGAAALLDSDSLTAQGPASSYDLPDLTVGSAAVMVGLVTGQGDNPNPITFTDDTGWDDVYQGRMSGDSLGPSHIVSTDVVTAGTHDYNPTGNHSVIWGGVLAAFDLGEGWVGGGYLSVDGDDATYTEVSGPNVIRIWLGDAFNIARVRLFIGCENSGAKSYTLKGANAADYSDAVTVATIAWTATGSFAGDEVVETWDGTTAYEFWELTGDDETRYVYSFELYEASLSVDLTAVEARLDDIEADTDPVTGLFVTKIDGGLETVQAHGSAGATETIDLGNGNWHSLTLNADCTITVTGFTTAMGCSVLVKVTQDGSGGHAIVWDSDIVFASGADDQPAQGAGDISWFVLASDEGDGTIYGFPVGGGSGGTPASTVESETTFGLSPAVGTDTEYARQDHTHGTPTNPVTEAAVQAVGHYEVLMDGGSPPEPLESGSGTDWLYTWVTP